MVKFEIPRNEEFVCAGSLQLNTVHAGVESIDSTVL